MTDQAIALKKGTSVMEQNAWASNQNYKPHLPSVTKFGENSLQN
jgi:hypothetical protein